MSTTYIPYQNLTIDWIKEGKTFSLSLPWTHLDIEIDDPEKEWVMDAIARLRTTPQAENVQKFLCFLQSHTVAYCAPRQEEQVQHLSIDTLEDCAIINLETPQVLAKTINKQAATTLISHLPEAWEWSLDAVLKPAAVNLSNRYDPLSLTTLVIGKRLEAESLTQQARQDLPVVLERLRQDDESLFFEKMKTLIRQTHYITSRFEECVRPALATFLNAKSEIEEFMAEEKGHDRLMASALKELGCEDPTTIAPMPGTILLMDLFKYASQTSPLAFTLIVGFFEGSAYGDSDPLADILARSSRPQAAKGYAVHYEINKNSRHCDTIMALARKLNLQTKGSAEFAVRLLELATLLGGFCDRSLVVKSEVK